MAGIRGGCRGGGRARGHSGAAPFGPNGSAEAASRGNMPHAVSAYTSPTTRPSLIPQLPFSAERRKRSPRSLEGAMTRNIHDSIFKEMPSNLANAETFLSTVLPPPLVVRRGAGAERGAARAPHGTDSRVPGSLERSRSKPAACSSPRKYGNASSAVRTSMFWSDGAPAR
jgi:hypothetical protein